jgi:DNA-binding response OmpR family regulator
MRRRLLLVEDDPTLRQALTFNLTREGYEVATAGDGEAALEAARSERLDLVLLDVMLPGMSGVEVLRVLRPELLARIEAVLRRHRREADEPERREQLSFDRVAIDVARREVRVDDEQIHLTTKEFDLLAHMAASPGRIFTRDQLLARIWGYDYVGDGRTVDVHVSWLRGKLRGADGHNYFRTVRGVGYAFTPRPT